MSESLPNGLKANIAAVMCMSLGKHHPEIVGTAAATADGVEVPGITRIPVPILTEQPEKLSALWAQSRDLDFAVPFTGAALTTKTYGDYEARLITATAAETEVHGLLLFGEKKAVNRLVGQLPLLR